MEYSVVDGRRAYIQSSQNLDSGSTARDLLLNPDGGNVGIGTDNPSAKLDVSGSGSSSVIRGRRTDSNGGYNIFEGYSDINGANVFTVSNNGVGYFKGNVGIGTESPDYLTTIAAGSGNTKLNLKRLNVAANGNAFGSLFYTNSDGTDVASVRAHRESAADDAYLGFATRSAGGSLDERLRITGQGKVEINSNGNYGNNAMSLNIGSRAQNIAGSLAIARGEILGGGTGPYLQLVHGPDGGTQRTHQIYSYIGDLRIYADDSENLELSGVETKIKDSSRNDVAIFNSNGLEMEKNTARLFGRYVGKTNTASNYELTDWTAGSFRILEVFGYINPNAAGSGSYYDPAHFYVYNATGWNGSAVSYYLGIKHVAPGARTYAPSGTGSDPTQYIVAKWANNNSTATTNGVHYLKFEWSGANTSHNYPSYFRVIRRM